MKKGFTIIEFLITLSIIAILAAIVLGGNSQSPQNRSAIPTTFRNMSNQIIETSYDPPLDWAKKHPYAKIILLSEFGGRTTIVYEEVSPKAEDK